jgi:hypothetical protein
MNTENIDLHNLSKTTCRRLNFFENMENELENLKNLLLSDNEESRLLGVYMAMYGSDEYFEVLKNHFCIRQRQIDYFIRGAIDNVSEESLILEDRLYQYLVFLESRYAFVLTNTNLVSATPSLQNQFYYLFELMQNIQQKRLQSEK